MTLAFTAALNLTPLSLALPLPLTHLHCEMLSLEATSRHRLDLSGRLLLLLRNRRRLLSLMRMQTYAKMTTY